jgi:hypothetical protein
MPNPICIFLLIALTFSVIGQSQDQLRIQRAVSTITVDAKMVEAAWQEAEVASGFRQYFPFDSSSAKVRTEVRLTYDDQFLYVFAIMHNNEPRQYITPSLRRDFRGEANDAFVLVLDTYQDKTNAFQFGVNPFGVQREGLVANGGVVSEDLALDWDNKWFSESRILPDRWECELAIPFKTIRYKAGLSSWNVNFYRIDSHIPERSTWSPIPRNNSLLSLAFSKQLIWDKPLQKTGSNISLIPYISETGSKDFEHNEPSKQQLDIGGDAKIALSSALNLDLTINPNFAQVEVDQQVTNLDRFEIFYPEKRQFFLENADLFSGFGSSGAQPFFSRRIGIARDTSTGQNINNPIYGGMRLSGKINNDWRIGLLSMQAAKDSKIDLPSTNYSVIALQRKIFSRSNISAILVNKQAFQDSIGGEFMTRPNKHNTVAGLDYNLSSHNGRWTGKFYYHHSFNDKQSKQDSAYSAGAILDYTSYRTQFSVFSRSIGNNFNPEVGFLRRSRFNQVAPEFFYWFYPRSSIINKHGPGTDVDLVWNDLYGLTDWDANLWYQIRFQNTAQFFTRIRMDYVYLFQDFDPSGTGGLTLPAGTSERWFNVVYSYLSDARRKVFFTINGRIGEYYNGHRQNGEGTISLRLQPHAVISLNFSYNRIRLPKPYSSGDLLLLAPRFDFTFSRKLFWTTYIQYNNQINNWNINSRLQWRFKPVSDLFIVYTDNYASSSYINEDGIFIAKGQPKLRAIAIKLSYWFSP